MSFCEIRGSLSIDMDEHELISKGNDGISGINELSRAHLPSFEIKAETQKWLKVPWGDSNEPFADQSKQ